MDSDFLSMARCVSGYHPDDVARIIGLDVLSYQRLELHSDSMTLRMIKALLPHINGHSVRLIHEAIDDIFLPYE